MQHVRTYVPFIVSLANRPLIFLAFLSLVGSTTLSTTYSINVRPYNDPFIAIAEEAIDSATELMIPGAFFVDILPALKYVPDWFPGANFQRKAAMMRVHSKNIRNAPFAATKNLMVFTPLSFSLDCSPTPWWCLRRQMATMILHLSLMHWGRLDTLTALTKTLIFWKTLQLWPMWVSPHVLYACYPFFWANGASPQQEQKPQLQLLGRSSWRWSAIQRCRRKLKKNSTKSSMEGFLNIAILCRFHTSRRLSRKFIGTVKFTSRILCLTLKMFLFIIPDGSL